MIRDRNTTERSKTAVDSVSRTKTDMAAACDINNILSNYRKTGVLTHFREGGTFAELPDAMDYQQAMNMVLDAQDMFMELPAELRKQLDQSPAKFLEFVKDEANRDVLRDYGLLQAEPAQDPTTPDPVTPAPPPEGDVPPSA